MIEVFLGILAGCLTGLVPGIHPNTLAVFLLSFSSLLPFDPLGFSLFIFSCALTHTFLSFIPSIFLGAPEDTTALSVLPGHRFLLEGRGMEAVYLTVVGGLGVVVLTSLLFPLLLFLLPALYSGIKPWIWLLLLGVAIFMILSEKRKLRACTVFLLAGCFGFILLSKPVLPLTLLFFPVFTGLFGLPTLLLSLKGRTSLPEQSQDWNRAEKPWGAVGRGWLAGLVMGVLPGLGASQAAVLVHEFGKRDLRSFLVSLGGVNTVASLISVLALYLISRPRSGVAVIIEKLVWVDFRLVLILIFCSLFVSGISAILTLRIASGFSKFLSRISYRKVVLIVLVFLVLLTALLTGPYGLLVLITGTAIGLLPIKWGLRRSHGMAVLMLPIILGGLGLM